MTVRRCPECRQICSDIRGAQSHYGSEHAGPIPPAEDFPTLALGGEQANEQRAELTGTPDKR